VISAVAPVFELPANFNQLADPYLLLRQFRDAGPVVGVRTASGMDGWLLTRYDDVRAGLADSRYSSDPACASERTRAAMASTMSRTVSMFAGTMVTSDPPDHTRLRKVASRGFTARPAEALRPRLRAVADRAVESIVEAGAGDLAAALADPLVAAMACELLGVPEAERGQVIAAMNAMVVMPVDERARRSADAAAAELQARFEALLARDVPDPPQDPLSVLAAARRDGLLSSAEASTTALLLLGSSVINPRGALGCALVTLLAHDDQRTELREGRAGLTSAANELLRYDGPLALGMVRYAAEDVELDGVTISAGSQVYMGIGSANRDERQFSEPDRLDLGRTHNPHIAFGNGIHRCLGVAATRVLLEVALAALLERAPDLALAMSPADIPWEPSVIRSPAGIPVS
jgi:cytochrome P450